MLYTPYSSSSSSNTSTNLKMPANTQKDQATLELARTLHKTPWCDDYEKMISGVL